MTAPDGGFYSATDADSQGPDGVEEGRSSSGREAEIRPGSAHGAARPSGSSRYYGVTAGGNFEGRNILRRRAARRGRRTRRWRPPARGAVRGARAPVAAAPRREDPGGLERPDDLGAGGGRARARRAALRRRGGARGGVPARAHARRGPPGTQPQGRAQAASPASSTTTPSCAPGLIDLFEATSDRRWLRARDGAGGRRPSGCSRIRGGRLVHDRGGPRARCSRARSRPTTAPSRRGRRSRCSMCCDWRRSRRTTAGARSPTARSRRWRPRWNETRWR